MKIFLHNTLSGLIPLYPSDHDSKKRLKIGVDYEADIKRPRNVGFHKKFFALLNIGFSNQDFYQDFETYRAIKTMECGRYKTIKTERGNEIYLPESISFASMDEDEFEKLYSVMVNLMIKDLHISIEDIEAELINFL